MLEIKNVTIKTNKDREIIKNLSFSIKQGDKLAIIGEEGNGKSTLLKYIYNKELIKDYTISSGNVIKNGIQIGYFEQCMNTDWNSIFVQDYFLKKNPTEEIDYEKYNELYKVEKIFNELKLDKEYLKQEKLVEKLSGGEKVKLQIAKILIHNPDVLLLDEPTNDLDIPTLEWLEEFILKLEIPAIFISHDEILLEKVSNCILHLEQINNKKTAKYTYEHIGYQEYVKKRRALINKQEQVAISEKREHEKQLEKYLKMYQQVDSDLNSVSRQDPGKARLLKKKMKSVKSVGKKIEEAEITPMPYVEEAIIAKFHNKDTIYNNKTILNISIDILRNEEKELSRNIRLQVIGKEKICIIGKNGCGKTTFLKQIYKEMSERKDIIVGYMPQNYEDSLPKEILPVEFLKENYTKEEETLVRTYMGSMKFTKEEMLQPIETLSGGQKAKLLLIKLILKKCNILLLDEPTRNLSPISVPVINKMLKNFKGAIISISHDRKYINEVCNTVYILEKEGLIKQQKQ